MSTRTSFCVMRTQSTGKTLSKTHASILWWCPQTAALHVSNHPQLWKTRWFDLTSTFIASTVLLRALCCSRLHTVKLGSCTVSTKCNLLDNEQHWGRRELKGCCADFSTALTLLDAWRTVIKSLKINEAAVANVALSCLSQAEMRGRIQKSGDLTVFLTLPSTYLVAIFVFCRQIYLSFI